MAKILHSSETVSVSEPIGRKPDKAAQTSMGFLSDVPVTVSVVMGRTTITVRELLELSVGSVLEINRPVDESFDLNINGAPFGKVEVSVIEDTYGLRIAEIVDPFEG
ncbi:MAG TPA: FliM/FliN family flagellar motor switch protein [bacterium]|nr:FliM/FliN family flagellar motor switch protein [bacterium]